MVNRLRRGLNVSAGLLLSCLAPLAVAAPIFWTDWTNSNTTNGFTAMGTITTNTASVDVTYNNRKGISFFYTGAAGETDFWAAPSFSTNRNPATSPYTSATVDNIPTGTDIIALQFKGSQTLTFSQRIANPVFSYVSLNGNGYAFRNQDFDILSQGSLDGKDCGYWGCGTATKVVVDLGGGDTEYQLNSTGGEPHGTIRFKGAFDSLTWDSSSNENWNGFTVGVQGTAAEVFNVPEPGSLVLFAVALLAVGVSRSRKSA